MNGKGQQSQTPSLDIRGCFKLKTGIIQCYTPDLGNENHYIIFQTCALIHNQLECTDTCNSFNNKVTQYPEQLEANQTDLCLGQRKILKGRESFLLMCKDKDTSTASFYSRITGLRPNHTLRKMQFNCQFLPEDFPEMLPMCQSPGRAQCVSSKFFSD